MPSCCYLFLSLFYLFPGFAPLSFGEAQGVWLKYASANNKPIHIVNNELIELPADKMPVGKGEYTESFITHEVKLNKGDTLYLFTDGYADQFGGESGEKKLTKKRFKELLFSIKDKPMQEQGIALETFITDYRKEVEQIDDILVVGIRL